MSKDRSTYRYRINDIYNKQLDPIFEKSNADFFKEKKLIYNEPLEDILEAKEEFSNEEFKRFFPLTVGELLKVIKSDDETEQEALIFICENELSPRGWALRRLL